MFKTLTQPEKQAYNRVVASFSEFLQREYKDDIQELRRKTSTWLFMLYRDPLDAVLDKLPNRKTMDYLSKSFGVQDVNAWFLSFERIVTLRDCSNFVSYQANLYAIKHEWENEEGCMDKTFFGEPTMMSFRNTFIYATTLTSQIGNLILIQINEPTDIKGVGVVSGLAHVLLNFDSLKHAILNKSQEEIDLGIRSIVNSVHCILGNKDMMASFGEHEGHARMVLDRAANPKQFYHV